MYIQVCAPPINGKDCPVPALTFPVIMSKRAAVGRIPCKTRPSRRYFDCHVSGCTSGFTQTTTYTRSNMNGDFRTPVNGDGQLETFAAELAHAAYHVALR